MDAYTEKIKQLVKDQLTAINSKGGPEAQKHGGDHKEGNCSKEESAQLDGACVKDKSTEGDKDLMLDPSLRSRKYQQ